MPVMPVLFAMERHGVLIDSRLLESQSHELGNRHAARLERERTRVAGQPFNLTRPSRSRRSLFEQATSCR